MTSPSIPDRHPFATNIRDISIGVSRVRSLCAWLANPNTDPSNIYSGVLCELLGLRDNVPETVFEICLVEKNRMEFFSDEYNFKINVYFLRHYIDYPSTGIIPWTD